MEIIEFWPSPSGNLRASRFQISNRYKVETESAVSYGNNIVG